MLHFALYNLFFITAVLILDGQEFSLYGVVQLPKNRMDFPFKKFAKRQGSENIEE